MNIIISRHNVLLFGTLLLFAARGTADETPAPAAKGERAEGVDLRPNFEKWGLAVKNQGSRNTCSVCVVTSAMEYALSRRHDKGLPLSVEYLNWGCNRVIGNKTEDRGQFFHDLLKGFDKHGICLETSMPYEAKFTNTEPTSAAKEDAAAQAKTGFKVQWIKRWSKKAGLSGEQMGQIRDVLDKGWPVCAGSGHSILLVGYTEDPKAKGGGRFLVADSGQGKFAERTFAFVQENMYDVFWVEVPLATR